MRQRQVPVPRGRGRGRHFTEAGPGLAGRQGRRKWLPRASLRTPEPPRKASRAPPGISVASTHAFRSRPCPSREALSRFPRQPDLLPAHLDTLDSELLQVNLEECFSNGFKKALVGRGAGRRDAEPPPTEWHRGIPKAPAAR